MKNLPHAFLSWLPLAVAIVFIYGFTYLAIQQYIRLSANEILVQYAEGTKERIEKGAPLLHAITGLEPVDMQKSLSPFVIIYDKAGTVQTSSATLHGIAPKLPAGVFAKAMQNGENRRTWQPETGIRNAIVVIPYAITGQEGFIVAGRSLREIEKREQFLRIQIAIGTITTLIATYAIVLIIHITRRRIMQMPK